MSVTVRHLNGDSSFLLVFSPRQEPTPDDLLSANGAFSLLIDPWLVGSSVVNAKWFAITERVVPSAISHLSQIEEPDVVLVSQNKPDHCHKQTLLQLKPEGKTLIAAEPGAAKAIKSWNHFDPHRVQALAKYDAKARFGKTLRLRIPPRGPDGLPGELNIAFIPAMNYVTGLHNAFGITYQAPTKVKVLAPVTTIDLPSKESSAPLTPASLPSHSPLPMLSPEPARPASSHIGPQSGSSAWRPMTAPGESILKGDLEPQTCRSSNTESSEFLAPIHQPTSPTSDQDSNRLLTAGRANSLSVPQINFDADALIDTTGFAATLPTPPLSPSVASAEESPVPLIISTNTLYSGPPSFPYSPSIPEIQSRYSHPPAVRPARPKAISCLYSPHGIPLSDLQPYIQNHLVPLPGALPLTCLLHGFDYAANPWWFGGNIMRGADGGLEIAKALMARCWISAHDEVKRDRGVAVKLLNCDRNSAELVADKIRQAEGSWECDVRSLDAGAEVRLGADSQQRKKPTYSGIGLGLEVGQFRFHDGG